jgi:hypothetical protein
MGENAKDGGASKNLSCACASVHEHEKRSETDARSALDCVPTHTKSSWEAQKERSEKEKQRERGKRKKQETVVKIL